MEITVKHTKIDPIFSFISKNFPKYDTLGSHRCVDEDSSILRCYVMSYLYTDTDVLKEDFGPLFRTKQLKKTTAEHQEKIKFLQFSSEID
jgi:hypothetical protein